MEHDQENIYNHHRQNRQAGTSTCKSEMKRKNKIFYKIKTDYRNNKLQDIQKGNWKKHDKKIFNEVLKYLKEERLKDFWLRDFPSFTCSNLSGVGTRGRMPDGATIPPCDLEQLLADDRFQTDPQCDSNTECEYENNAFHCAFSETR